MPSPLRLLIVADRSFDTAKILSDVRQAGYEPLGNRVDNEADFLAQLNPSLELILADSNLSQLAGSRALELLRARDLNIPFLVVSTAVEEESITFALQQGARLRAERQHTEQALRESEKRFRTLIEHSADAIALIDIEGKVLYATPSVAQVMGTPLDEMLGWNSFEHIHPDDLPAAMDQAAQFFQNPGLSTTAQVRVRHGDGSWRWFEVTATNLLDEPAVQAIVANYRDITERKQMETLLQESQARYRAILASAMDAIISVDAEQRILLFNAAAEQMFRCPAAEAIGQHLDRFIPDGFRAAHREHIRHFGETGVSSRSMTNLGALMGLRTNGEEFPIEASIAQVDMAGQKVYTAILRDVTERQNAEATLHASEERYRELFMSNPQPMWVYDVETLAFLAVNDATIEHYGYSEAEFLAMTIEDIRPSEEIPALVKNLREPPTRLESSGDWRHCKKDRTVILVEIRSHALEFAGRPARLVLATDITEKRRDELNLVRRNQELTALNQIGQALNRLAEPSDILELIFESIGEVLDNRNFYIALYNETTHYISFPIYTEEGVRQPYAGRFYTSGLTEHVLRTRLPLHISHNVAEAITQMGLTPIGRASQSFLAVPMIAGGKAVGVITLQDYQHAYAYDQSTVELLSTFAAQAAIALENARLYTATQQELAERKRAEEAEREQRALAEALRDTAATLNSTLDFEEVLQRILDLVDRVVPHDTANIMLIEGKTIHVVRTRGYRPPGTPDQILGMRLRLDDFEAQREMIETGQPLVVPDTRREPRWVTIPEAKWIRSFLSVPIQIKGEVVGFLNLDSATPDFFNDAHAARLRAFADQAATALENARLLAETKRRAQEFAALYEMTRDLATQRDLSTLLQTIIERATHLLDASSGSILLYDAARQELEIVVTRPPEYPIGTRVRVGEGMAGRVAQTYEPLIVDDYGSWEGRWVGYGDVPFKASIEVPMLYGGELIGVLAVNEIEDSTRKFTEADAGLLSLFASQAAGAVHNARLLQETETRAQQLSLLYDAGLTLNSVREPRVQLQFLTDIALKTLRADLAEFFIYDPTAATLRFQSGKGHTPSALANLEQVSFPIGSDRGLVSWVAEHRVPVNLPDVKADPRYLIIESASRSGLWVPVERENKLLGVLVVFRNELKPFTPHDERLLVLFANQVAVALENARLFSETRQRLAELEAVNRLSVTLRAAQSLDEMLPRMLDETLAVLNATDGEISLFNPATLAIEPAVTRGWPSQLDATVKPPDGIAGLVFTTGQPYVAREFKTDRQTSESARSLLPEGMGGAIVPIRTAQETVGLLFVSVPLPREVKPDEVRLLTTLAEIAGNAIHRTRLHEQTEERVQRLDALRNIDAAITSSHDLSVTLRIFLDQVAKQLRADAADILLYSAPLQSLEYAAGLGFHDKTIERTRLRLGEGYAGRAALEQQTLQLTNLAEAADIRRRDLVENERLVSYFVTPLLSKGQVKGVLEVYTRREMRPDAEWLGFFEALATQAAIAIDDATLFVDLQHVNMELGLAYDTTLETWAHALDLRDQEPVGHTRRVTELTMQLARVLGSADEELVHIRRGAILHDIGNMGIPESILLKAGPLTEEEWKIVRSHPGYAYDLLSPIKYLRPMLDIPYRHHEKWDGTGYPRGLKGEEIPLAARVFAVVDVWDALLSERPYRPAWSGDKVREHIRAQAGLHFDPNVVESFLHLEL